MSNTIIHGVNIILDGLFTPDASYGLYTVVGHSEFRWSEAPVTGLSEGWCNGIILENGIDAIEEGADLTRGGAPVEYSGFNVSIINTFQFSQWLKDQGIFFTNCQIILTEFIGTILDSDSVSRTIIFTGVSEDKQFTETALIIPMKNNTVKNNLPLFTLITEADVKNGANNGSMVPMTFGKFAPILPSVQVDNLATFLRSNDNQTVLGNDYFTSTHPEIIIFPLIGIITTTQYQIQTQDNTPSISTLTPDECYVSVVSGTGSGQLRQVAGFDLSSYNRVNVNIKDVFATELSVVNDGTRSWLKFTIIKRNYACDTWPCTNFLDWFTGNAVTSPQLYGVANSQAQPIGNYGLTIKNTDNNNLQVDGEQYSDDINTLKDFIILPVTSLARETTSDLSQWPIAGWTGYAKADDGIYFNLGHTITSISNNTLTDASKSYDKDSTTFASYNPILHYDNTGTSSTRACTVLKFGIPILPTGTAIKNIYFGIKIKNSVYNPTETFPYDSQGTVFVLAMRRFAYSNTNDYVQINKNAEASVDDPNIDCLPDFYYDNKPTTNNVNFYKTVNGPKNFFGYSLFQIPSCDLDTYATYIEGALFLNGCVYNPSAGPNNDYTFNNKIYQLAIILELDDSNIADKIFSPLSGRIYNSTWGTRKTAAGMISNPVDILEHVKRLASGGLTYNAGALIRTSGDGSYDATSLATIKGFTPNFQILNDADAWSLEVAKKICQTFNICTFYDKQAYECVQCLTPVSSSESITLSDIIGDIGQVQDAQIKDIFCEPIVNYNYDYAAGQYNNTLQITNADAASYNPSYAIGFSGDDGSNIWSLCHQLYQKYRDIEIVPSDFSDQEMIHTYTDALGYLFSKLYWMENKRVSLSVNYDKGKYYHFAQHIMLTLPHQTNNVAVECIIEKVKKDKNNNLVTLNLIILYTSISLPE